MFLPHPRVKVSIVGSLRDREVACSASDRQGSNFESCVWRTGSFQSSYHPHEVLLAQFSLYVHKGDLKPDSFHFCHAPLGLYNIIKHMDKFICFYRFLIFNYLISRSQIVYFTSVAYQVLETIYDIIIQQYYHLKSQHDLYDCSVETAVSTTVSGC